MTRIRLMAWMIILVAPSAFSQSDEEILEKVRTNAEKIYLGQASFTLPESFHNSGLAPSDKKRLIEQWANDSATCMADALAVFTTTTDVPLSELVSNDGTFGLRGGSPTEFERYLKQCLAQTWEAVGAKLPE